MSVRVARSVATLLTAALSCTALAACGFLGGADEDLDVVRYEGPAITAADASAGWSATVEDGEVTLEYTDPYFPGGESTLITLRDVEAALPHLERVWVGPIPGYGQTMKEATVRIQDWNVRGVVSGELRGEMPSGGKVVSRFWVNLADPAEVVG